MHPARLVLLLVCLALAANTAFALERRKGGGGGKPSGGGSGGGGSKPSGGGGGSKPSGGGSSNKGSNSGMSTGIRGGGGSSGKGSGSYGDKPPSYASLFPDRSGFNAGGAASGVGNSAFRYTPPPPYSARATYVSANRGQTVLPTTFSSNSPAVYYASAQRGSYPGAWGYGFYPVYPYPFWAYGAGFWVGSTYYTSTYSHGINSITSEFRNITVVNATNYPLIGDADLFNNTHNVTFVDFNNGSLQIGPCGNASSSTLNVPGTDCDFIVLNIKDGKVVRGNAESRVVGEITFFDLHLGSNTTTLRTQTISSTKKSAKGGIIAGIVLGVVGFVAIVIVAIVLFCRYKKRH